MVGIARSKFMKQEETWYFQESKRRKIWFEFAKRGHKAREVGRGEIMTI